MACALRGGACEGADRIQQTPRARWCGRCRRTKRNVVPGMMGGIITETMTVCPRKSQPICWPTGREVTSDSRPKNPAWPCTWRARGAWPSARQLTSMRTPERIDPSGTHSCCPPSGSTRQRTPPWPVEYPHRMSPPPHPAPARGRTHPEKVLPLARIAQRRAQPGRQLVHPRRLALVPALALALALVACGGCVILPGRRRYIARAADGARWAGPRARGRAVARHLAIDAVPIRVWPIAWRRAGSQVVAPYEMLAVLPLARLLVCRGPKPNRWTEADCGSLQISSLAGCRGALCKETRARQCERQAARIIPVSSGRAVAV